MAQGKPPARRVADSSLQNLAALGDARQKDSVLMDTKQRRRKERCCSVESGVVSVKDFGQCRPRCGALKRGPACC